MVFYLKYRPKRIAELDSEHLRERLVTVLRGKLPDKIPHAFLFTGPKGLGKTSTARILAKAINCTNRKASEIEPCNVCASCKSINNGSSLDVIELDGASNRGIDEIRDLREKIRLAPASSLKKIYIIDEVHMLTAEAFNALLKTLEEPPSHAVFILCTTEPQKVPATIISRCFQVKFVKANSEDLLNSFQRIVKGEEAKAEKEALAAIASLSDGSFRDGAKILEELLAHSSNLTLSLVEKKYKTKTINKSLEDLVHAFVKRDARAAVKIVETLSREGIDFKLFVEDLINFLHKSLLLQIEGEKFDLTISETKNLIEMLVGAHVSIKYSVLPQLPLELTIIEWNSLESSENSKDQSLSASNKPSTIGSGNDKILLDLINEIKKENFSIAGVLRGCSVSKFNKKELILSTDFKFHKERLNERKTSDLIEKHLEKIIGNKIKFSVI